MLLSPWRHRQNTQRAQSKSPEQLPDSEERFRSVVQTANDAIICADSSGTIVFWNQSAERIFGYRADEVLGKQLDCIIPERLRRDHNRGMSRVASTGESTMAGQTVEMAGLRKDGSELPVELSVAAWSAGSKLYFTGIVRDITRRKRLEEQLLRAQRLEIAGRIAGQVAHDFNNLLSPLVAFPELIKMELPEGHPAIKYCDAMLEAALQLADINNDLLALGRRGQVPQEPTDLNRLVQQALTHTAAWPKGLTIDLNLAPDLLPVKGSPAQLLRVILNLLTNAREAMQDIGAVKLKTENVYVDRPLGSYNRVEIGEYVRLEVADTGCGIPPEIRDKIFDAFFTTKRTDRRRGSGLGLTVVQAIVKDHGGYLDLESDVGRGTTFTIYLPVCREATPQRLSSGYPGGTETILVVDDDPTQREVARELLSRLGYHVETVASGEEALAYLQDHATDLLILDMVMPPGIDGAETYRRIVQMRPGQRAIIVSGHAASARVQLAQSLGAGPHLAKPVTLERLASAVRSELDRC